MKEPARKSTFSEAYPRGIIIVKRLGKVSFRATINSIR